MVALRELPGGSVNARGELRLYAISATLAEAAIMLGEGDGEHQRVAGDLKSIREDLIRVAKAEDSLTGRQYAE